MSDIPAPYAPPSTARDVAVVLPGGRKAYGYYVYFGWLVYPNEYPCPPVERNPMNAHPCAVIGWHEIEPVYA